MPPWVNALQVSISLLFLSVVAATSLAEERVRGSLDVLMTTPLETWEIVIGKWLGTFRLVPPLAILPVLVVFGAAHPQLRWQAAIEMAAFVLCAGATITGLGLGMATWCPRLGRAVGLTVSVYLLVTVGWLFAVMAFGHGPGTEELLMGSPFFWAGAMTDDVLRSGVHGHQGATIFWTLFYAATALRSWARRSRRSIAALAGSRATDLRAAVAARGAGTMRACRLRVGGRSPGSVPPRRRRSRTRRHGRARGRPATRNRPRRVASTPRPVRPPG